MKICVISEHEYGMGAAIAAHRIADQLGKDGHDVYFVYWYKFSSFYERKDHINYVHIDGITKKRDYIFRLWCLKERIASALTGFRRGKSPFEVNLQSPDTLVGWSKRPRNIIIYIMYLIFLKCASVVENWTYGAIYRIVKAKIDKIRPDVINLHNVSAGLTHKKIAQLANSYPVAWTLHDCFAFRLYKNNWQDYYGDLHVTWGRFVNFKRSQQELLNFLKALKNITFICPSLWMLNNLNAELDDNVNCHHIPNGLPLQEYSQKDRCVERKKLGLKDEKFYALFLATNRSSNSLKNYAVIEKAKDLLGNQKIEIITPDLWPQSSLSNTKFSTEFVSSILSAADVLIVPSLIENFPNTILEGFSCRIPVIASNVGGIPEIVNKNTGSLFNPFDSSQLAEILSNYVSQQDDNILKKVNFAFDLISKEFSLEIQSSKYNSLFKRIICDFKGR